MPTRTKPTSRSTAPFRALAAALAAALIALAATGAAGAPRLPGADVERPLRHEEAALVIRWCSEQTPDRCRTHLFPLPGTSPMCMIPVQFPRLTPPGWRVVAWRCVRPGQVVRSFD